MRIELTANVSIPAETLIDMDRSEFLEHLEGALGSPLPVDGLTYNLVGTYGRQELTFAVKGTVDEDTLNESVEGVS